MQELDICPVLKENHARIYGRTGLNISESSFLTTMNHFANSVETITKPINIYDGILDELCEKFHILEEHKEALRQELEQIAVLYIMLYSMRFLRPAFEGWLKQLDDLGKTAAKLQWQVPKYDVDFYEKLSFFDHFEEDQEDDVFPKDFFNDVIRKLEIIKNLKYNVINSNLGKHFGLNMPSRKKNHALNVWIAAMYNFWHCTLGRDFSRDSSGLGGRKRFLEFLEACIMPVHPEIVSDIGNPLGRLDTALKGVQREVKLHEENTSQK